MRRQRNLKVGQYRFRVYLHVKCRVSASVEKVLLPIIQKAMPLVPKSALLKCLGKNRNRSLGVILVSRSEIETLNRNFRNKSKPTDVLSFPQAPLPMVFDGEIPAGDIIICTSVAREQARKWNATTELEVQRLAVHGLLHLFGYDHERSSSEANKMFQLQERILKLIAK
jgi:probable rRNA maturation factor